ncbi:MULTISPECIES: hypothetical protein [unclassified Pseudovibrio]|nr:MULTISPECIES: hypothetical protein [unclassified Pseudovibrio]KZL22277.1 hypothetical protein PsWM33_04043 [Pseudovibrio sp. WM33]KZL27705.1 hypothetical protein PsAD37_01143 [Pseudovibrio sp. Ad37]
MHNANRDITGIRKIGSLPELVYHEADHVVQLVDGRRSGRH